MKLSDYKYKSLTKLGEGKIKGRWSNVALVQLIELEVGFKNNIRVQRDFYRLYVILLTDYVLITKLLQVFTNK